MHPHGAHVWRGPDKIGISKKLPMATRKPHLDVITLNIFHVHLRHFGDAVGPPGVDVLIEHGGVEHALHCHGAARLPRVELLVELERVAEHVP